MADVSVTAARPFTTNSHGLFDTALVATSDGRRLLVRAPSTATSVDELKADSHAVRTLSTGIRSRLPFDLPVVLSETSLSPSKTSALPVSIYDFLDGVPLDASRMGHSPELVLSVARAMNAIHGLPTSFVADAGLPVRSALDSKAFAIAVIERAADSGRVPSELTTRWTRAADDPTVWRFDPTVINGSLTVDSFLVTGDSLSGIVGWAALSVGDPAHDMRWLVNANGDATFAEYALARRGSSDPQLHVRASLYSELEIARWLLHGIDERNDSIIDDAVRMLDRLAAGVQSESLGSLSPATGPVLDVSAVEDLLDETPGDGRPLESAARYAGFAADTDDHIETSSRSE